MTSDNVDLELVRLVAHGRRLGDVMVGLPADDVREGAGPAGLTWDQRREVVSSVGGIGDVVVQAASGCAGNVGRFQPDFLLMAADPDSDVRAALASYGGRLVDAPALPPHPRSRRSVLPHLLETQPIVRLVEAHSPLAAFVAAQARAEIDGATRRFHGLWSSSLADATVRGKRDTEAVGMDERLDSVASLLSMSDLPLLFDAETGGPPAALARYIARMEALGVAGAVIEDKVGLKQNSLLGPSRGQRQEDVEVFAEKISVAASTPASGDFLVVARVESLTLDNGLDDALMRAQAYVKAGANAVMIHSRRQQPDEVLEFAGTFRTDNPCVPLVAVPTTYSGISETDLASHGFNIIIYANHLLRAALPAMQRVAEQILVHERAGETESQLMPIPELLNLFGETRDRPF